MKFVVVVSRTCVLPHGRPYGYIIVLYIEHIYYMLGLHWDHAFHALHVLEKREGRRGSCDQSGMILVERA